MHAGITSVVVNYGSSHNYKSATDRFLAAPGRSLHKQGGIGVDSDENFLMFFILKNKHERKQKQRQQYNENEVHFE